MTAAFSFVFKFSPWYHLIKYRQRRTTSHLQQDNSHLGLSPFQALNPRRCPRKYWYLSFSSWHYRKPCKIPETWPDLNPEPPWRLPAFFWASSLSRYPPAEGSHLQNTPEGLGSSKELHLMMAEPPQDLQLKDDHAKEHPRPQNGRETWPGSEHPFAEKYFEAFLIFTSQPK